MRKLLPWILLLAGCAGATPPEITAKSEELESLRKERRVAIDRIRELPVLQKRRRELTEEKAALLLRKQKAGLQ